MDNAWAVRFGMAAAFLAVSSSALAGADAGPGAAVPWTTYEAEQLSTNGTVLGPDYTGHTPAREASGRRCVRLEKSGDYVEWRADADAQGLVVRYCIPDSPDGRGTDATIGLLINGQPKGKVPLTSRYAYLYGKYPFTNTPADGLPRHVWDEARLMPGDVHRGDTLRLEKRADDPAGPCLIDFVETEPVAPPLPMPAGAESVMDHGAKADGRTNDLPAFKAAVAAAQGHGGCVWIPPGRYRVEGPIIVHDVAVRGAGMWHSTLVGADDATPERRVSIEGAGPNVTLADFAIVGTLNYRNDAEPNDGLVGTYGTGSAIQRVWVEHTKTGGWLTNSDGLQIEGCRFRDTIADGLNLCVGMRNTLVQNCTSRGNGDDGFAVWPATYAPAAYPPGHNRIVHCTVQTPALAQGFSIYGGEGNSVENCAALDIPYGAGLFASTTFPTAGGFSGITQFARARVVRAGDAEGAVGTVADKLDLSGLRFTDIDVTDSAGDAVRFTSMRGHALDDCVFEHMTISGTGLAGRGYGVTAGEGAVGSATLRDVRIAGTKSGDVSVAPGFVLHRDDAATGTAGTTAKQ